jgi:hypothetical protein
MVLFQVQGLGSHVSKLEWGRGSLVLLLSIVDRSIRTFAYFSFSGEGKLILAACEKFIGGVVDPGEQFLGGVIDTGEKC